MFRVANGAPAAPASLFPRFLNISEFSGTGTCIGDIESEDEDLNTWEELLAEIDLQIAPRYRGYVGKVTLPDETSIEAVLWVVGVVRSTAEFDGPVAVVGFPEALIDYADTLATETPGCASAHSGAAVGAHAYDGERKETQRRDHRVTPLAPASTKSINLS